jgi:hypothetical protein
MGIRFRPLQVKIRQTRRPIIVVLVLVLVLVLVAVENEEENEDEDDPEAGLPNVY